MPESPGLQGGAQVFRPGQLQAGQRVAFEQLLDDQVLLRSGEELRRPRQRQDAFGLGPPDQVEGIGRPGPCRRGAQAPVQPGGEAVPKRIRGEPARGQDQHPLRVHAVAQGPADGGFDQDRGFAGSRARRGPGRVRNRAGRRRRPAGPVRAPGRRCGAGGAEAAGGRSGACGPCHRQLAGCCRVADRLPGCWQACRILEDCEVTSHGHFIIGGRQFMQPPLQPVGNGVDAVEVGVVGAHRAATRSTRQRPSPVRR